MSSNSSKRQRLPTNETNSSPSVPLRRRCSVNKRKETGSSANSASGPSKRRKTGTKASARLSSPSEASSGIVPNSFTQKNEGKGKARMQRPTSNRDVLAVSTLRLLSKLVGDKNLINDTALETYISLFGQALRGKTKKQLTKEYVTQFLEDYKQYINDQSKILAQSLAVTAKRAMYEFVGPGHKLFGDPHWPNNYNCKNLGPGVNGLIGKIVPKESIRTINGKDYVVMYHGTDGPTFDGLLTGIAFDKGDGALGKGLYMTPHINEAKCYACHRSRDRAVHNYLHPLVPWQIIVELLVDADVEGKGYQFSSPQSNMIFLQHHAASNQFVFTSAATGRVKIIKYYFIRGEYSMANKESHTYTMCSAEHGGRKSCSSNPFGRDKTPDQLIEDAKLYIDNAIKIANQNDIR